MHPRDHPPRQALRQPHDQLQDRSTFPDPLRGPGMDLGVSGSQQAKKAQVSQHNILVEKASDNLVERRTAGACRARDRPSSSKRFFSGCRWPIHTNSRKTNQEGRHERNRPRSPATRGRPTTALCRVGRQRILLVPPFVANFPPWKQANVTDEPVSRERNGFDDAIRRPWRSWRFDQTPRVIETSQ